MTAANISLDLVKTSPDEAGGHAGNCLMSLLGEWLHGRQFVHFIFCSTSLVVFVWFECLAFWIKESLLPLSL